MFCKTLTFFEKISVTRNQCFPVYCQLQNENVAGKVEREDQFLSGIMWKAGDWISCYYSQYKAEKASKKKFEDWPRPDGSKTF